MDKQEKIVCAAVKVARVKSDYKGVKIVTGVDYQSIYNDGVLSYLANDQDTNIWQNGFITSKNRFVDAKEAYKIAVDAKQIPSKTALIIDIDYRIIKAKNSKHYYSTATIKELEAEREIILNRLEELKLEDLY